MVVKAILCAGAYLEEDNKFLLVQEKDGKYNFPMGCVEKNESIEEACIREVQEETGYHVCLLGIKKILYVHRRDLTAIKFLFNVKIITKIKRHFINKEVIGIRYVSLDEFKSLHEQGKLKSKDMLQVFRNKKLLDYYEE